MTESNVIRMYITYDCAQYRVEHVRGDTSGPHIRPPRRVPSSLKKPSFMPTYLTRASDMKRVSGVDVNEGYCAISYSWNCSGEIIKRADGKGYDRVDGCLHKIFPSDAREPRYVAFEDVIQQICKDFNINYVWYDQICIDQADKKHKEEEIKQMHLVYRHAHCTVVLVPEFEVQHKPPQGISRPNIDAIGNSEWCKRSWTLEEAYMSQKLLFIGRNTHMWSQAVADGGVSATKSEHLLHSICRTAPRHWNASVTLWHAHGRRSTKAHDEIFALFNMFPGFMDSIRVSYDQPLQDLMTQFYGLLAAKDLSILCFGRPSYPDPDPKVNEIQRSHLLLPSWTGVSGMHIPQLITAHNFSATAFTDYIVMGSTIEVRNCTYFRATIGQSSQVNGDAQLWFFDCRGFCIIPESGALTFIPTTDKRFGEFSTFYGLEASHWLPATRDGYNMLTSPECSGGFLSLTVEDCTECIILSGISFNTGASPTLKAFPVIQHSQNHFKSIGMFFTHDLLCIDFAVEATFTIQ